MSAARKRVAESSDEEEESEKEEMEEEKQNESGGENGGDDDDDDDENPDDDDFVPDDENEKPSKRAKTSDLVPVTDESVNAFWGMFSGISGPNVSNDVLKEKATECASLQTQAYLCALEGRQDGHVVRGKLMRKMVTGNKVAHTDDGAIFQNTSFQTNEKYTLTAPGIDVGIKLPDNELGCFHLKKEFQDKHVKEFTRVLKPSLFSGLGVLAMFKVPEGGKRPFSEDDLTHKGVLKLLKAGVHFTALASVKIFLLSGALRRVELPLLALENGSAMAPTESPESQREVHICLEELHSWFVVPVNEGSPTKQLKAIANRINFDTTVKNLQKDLANTINVSEKEVGYNNMTRIAATAKYMQDHNENPKKFPFYGGFVVQIMSTTEFQEHAGPNLVLKFSTFNKLGNENILLNSKQITLKVDPRSFFEGICNKKKNPVIESHTDWMTVNRVENAVRALTPKSKTETSRESAVRGATPKTKNETFPQSAFMTCESELFSMAGKNACNSMDITRSIFNVQPTRPLSDLKAGAEETTALSNSGLLAGPTQVALKIMGETMSNCARLSSDTFTDADPIFSDKSIAIDSQSFQLSSFLSSLDEGKRNPTQTKISELFAFKNVKPSDAIETRNLIFLEYRFVLAYIHCNNPVSVGTLIENFFYNKPDPSEYDCDVDKRFYATEKRKTETLEAVSLVVSTLSLCASFVDSMIDKLNEGVVDERTRFKKDHLRCLKDFNPNEGVVHIATLALRPFGIAKAFNPKYTNKYSDQDTFIKYLCVAHTFATDPNPDDADMQKIMNVIDANKGPTDVMKLELETYMMGLIKATYAAVPEKKMAKSRLDFLDSDDESESEEEDATAATGAAAAAAAAAADAGEDDDSDEAAAAAAAAGKDDLAA